MRTSGILMPVSSLPSPYGIGSLGAEAYRFVDFLAAAGQRYWQILPIGPTGYGDSPYQSFSAFAANPYFIDLDALEQRGLLTHDEIARFDFGPDAPEGIDYGALFRTRFAVLELAVRRFDAGEDAFRDFCAANAFWLDDYALFMALKAENGMRAFSLWPKDVRARRPAALAAARARLAGQVRFWQVVQYLFYEQWAALKAYANAKGVEFIGDIPIYVSPDSSDLWADPSLFQVDADGALTEVAGYPPDAFAADGQLWGNPLYNWDVHLKTGCAWWIRRLRHASAVYDVVRIDHFRGFESYYAIPARDKTAVNGVWRKGPGTAFIDVIRRKLPDVRIIAEDLGYLTDDVKALLRASGRKATICPTTTHRILLCTQAPTTTPPRRTGSFRLRPGTWRSPGVIWMWTAAPISRGVLSAQRWQAFRSPPLFPCRTGWALAPRRASTRPPRWAATGCGAWTPLR